MTTATTTLPPQLSLSTTPQGSGGAVSVNAVPFTAQIWASLVLFFVGAPVTSNNVNNMLHWMTAENYPATWYTRDNPLNASLGSSTGGPTGSMAGLYLGARNTAAMIVGAPGSGITPQIMNALRADAPLAAFSAAVEQSNWDGGHYNNNPSYIASTTPVPANATSAGETFSIDPTQVIQDAANIKGKLVSSVGATGSTGAGNTIANLPAGAAGIAAQLASQLPGPLKGLADVFASLTTIFGDLSSAAWWKRVGIFVLGGALLVGGLILFVSTTKTGREAETAAVAAI